MKRVKIGYVFRRPVKKLLAQTARGEQPKDALYGLTGVQNSFDTTVLDATNQSRLVSAAQYGFNKVVLQFVDSLGFSLLPTISMVGALNRCDLIFATSDTYGLPIAFLKKIGLIQKPLVFNTVGLYDALVRKNNPLARGVYKTIMSDVEHILSGGSFQECKKLSELLDIPIERFSFISFGIDTTFFHPKKTADAHGVLAVGADPSRDWELLLATIRALPAIQFRIVTLKDRLPPNIPTNAVVEYNLSFAQVRQRIWQSACVILLTKHNHYFSGQSTMFRAMACAKPVIISDSPSLAEYQLQKGRNCIIVPCDDQQAAMRAIIQLNDSISLRQTMGGNARKMIVNDHRLDAYTTELKKLFRQILNTTS